MSGSNTGTVGFQTKFLLSWLITGAVLGLIVGITAMKESGVSAVFGSIVGFPIWYVSQAGLGMLFDAAKRHNWKFGEIEHQPWVWYIYPIVGILDIVYSFGGFSMVNA
jgi:hypothetical protein